ncbi:hypothetical protein ASPWEDRAFT_593616 [Aspergillus wentii DTO 134E9]|uniref:Uncharacterized protein n=1 Tax=Aspergillus wentii DTO 134E9 TaxID=1073089 RepID=A0A1L9RD18_ASPWE|nr:uncharacterized protein ASPWEDRAFT_593616 [Aspergillus wentii DTO 134E9]OJJ32802.1 hypothetical protein ASPWEDRAFT_593616 [Aspergillus wentii DTO 134E9]
MDDFRCRYGFYTPHGIWKLQVFASLSPLHILILSMVFSKSLPKHANCWNPVFMADTWIRFACFTYGSQNVDRLCFAPGKCSTIKTTGFIYITRTDCINLFYFG